MPSYMLIQAYTFFFFPFYFTQGQKGFVNYIPSELQVLELGKMLSRSIFLAYFKVASRNMYNFSEIFPLTLLFGHPYTFIRNQKKIPPTPLNGVIWSYTLIKFSDFVLLTLLFGLILYSELQSNFPGYGFFESGVRYGQKSYQAIQTLLIFILSVRIYT